MDSQLKDLYNRVYAEGKGDHFLKYRDGRRISAAHEVALDWINSNVSDLGSLLDFGCGEADFLSALPSGVRRIGIDYSEVAIAHASANCPECELVRGSEEELSEFEGSMDVVTSFGTLEHVDDPSATFGALARCLKPGGSLIVSCPSFLNVRGVIWMTLVKLFDVPMSLSDRHFLSPRDFSSFATNHDMSLIDMISVDSDIAQGKEFRRDMEKRLKNALSDAKMNNSNLDDLVSWIEDNMQYFAEGRYTGVEMVYIVRPNTRADP